MLNPLVYGIGVHHGRLPRALAQLQVRLFNKGVLKFLVCTSTLIEGVNTAAKHVIIYDNKTSRKPIDYFTYRNIQGRSGRMFRYFVGTVHLFHNPPQPELLDVDFPVFSQTDTASDGLLVQLSESDLGKNGMARVNRIESQVDLSMETIRANAHVDPMQQIQVARIIRDNAKELHSSLVWRGQPTTDQIYKMCEILFDTLLADVSRGAVRSDRQLAFLISKLCGLGAAGFVRDQALSSGPRVLSDPSERVENALEFLRNWASFHFPKALTALDRIQEEIFGGFGMNVGSYSAFAVRLENQMLPPGLAALDEYGLPVQVALRVEKYLPVDGGIDEVLDGLKTLAVEELELESFEKELLREVVESL